MANETKKLSGREAATAARDEELAPATSICGSIVRSELRQLPRPFRLGVISRNPSCKRSNSKLKSPKIASLAGCTNGNWGSVCDTPAPRGSRPHALGGCRRSRGLRNTHARSLHEAPVTKSDRGERGRQDDYASLVPCRILPLEPLPRRMPKQRPKLKYRMTSELIVARYRRTLHKRYF